MNSFFLKLAGLDEFIVAKVDNKKKYLLAFTGVLVLGLFLFSFFSTFYLLTFLVSNKIVDCFVALLYSTIVMNFYRFTLSSITWRSEDPDKVEKLKQPDILSTLIRMATCGFFIVLVSKPFELWVLHSGIISKILKNKPGFLDEKLYEDFEIMNRHYPEAWLITVLTLILFLWPIFFRSCSKKWGNYEYEMIHNTQFIIKIRANYLWFLEQYNDAFKKREINVVYRTQYADPPFNKELKPAIVNTKGKKLEESANLEFYDELDDMPLS